MVDVGDKPVTDREAVARGSITMSRDARAADPQRRGEKGRSAAGRPAGRHHGGEADLRAHPAVPSAAAIERARRADADRARLRHRSARSNHGADRRRDGGADGRGRRGADHLRHGQGGRQVHGHRRHPPHVQERRTKRNIQNEFHERPRWRHQSGRGVEHASRVGRGASSHIPAAHVSRGLGW